MNVRHPSEGSYHHGDLRTALLETCCQHISREGTEGLSLRALAREAGVSPTAPYRHFESRQALLAALATQGFEELAAAMGAQGADDPVRALFECSMAYIRYAEANPVKYHLMFGDVIGDFSGHDELVAAGCACYEQIEAVLARGLDCGALRDADLREVGGTVWAMVHGLAGLVLTARRKATQQPLEQILEVPPLCAQHAVAAAPERALLRLMEGLVTDPASLAALRDAALSS